MGHFDLRAAAEFVLEWGRVHDIAEKGLCQQEILFTYPVSNNRKVKYDEVASTLMK